MISFKCGQTYIYLKLDRGGTKTILGPARALRTRAGKTSFWAYEFQIPL